jgi:type II secretory pathway predicted ATPase ExeA
VSERAEGIESFPVTADPDNYVQTAAGEDALAALRREVYRGTAPVVLVGATGVGKTMVLRVLERRLESSFRVVYLPFAALPADELCTWILGLLGESAGRDPEQDLLAASHHLESTGSPLLVLLDDAGSMPVATARRLSGLFSEAEGALHLVLALSEDSSSGQMISSFQPPAIRVELRTLMNAEETARYLRAHLIRGNAPQEIRARFDPTSIRYLHRGSGGVPRVLASLAGEVVRGNLSVLPRQESAAPEHPLGFGPDPFGVTSDPADYVPRQATQELLESVEESLRKGARAVAVTGPPGLGKTMLLRVLERRLRGHFRALRISYTALLPDEFSRWILTLLGQPVREDAEADLLHLAQRLGDSQTTLVLLLDDAGSIPIPTVRSLVELAGEAEGTMRVVLFAAEDVRTGRILEALGSDAVALRFSEPMSEEETAKYIHARLARAAAPKALVAHFDPEVVAQIHLESEGIPREIHKLAGELYRGGNAAVAIPEPTSDLTEAPAESDLQTATLSPEPSVEPVPEPAARPAPEPVRPRFAIRGRHLALGLLAVALLLAAVPLLRGGVPWRPATPWTDRAAEPPAGAPSLETPSPTVREQSGELIAVNINATPWASIEVDGEYFGVTPLAGVLLPPGPHVFRARMADGEIREHRVEVGETMRHVVFYAEVPPEEIQPKPETAALPGSSPPTSDTLPEVAAEPSPGGAPAEIPAVSDQAASARATPAPAPEPPGAPLSPRPPPEEPPEIAVTVERLASVPASVPPPPAPEPEVPAAPLPPPPVAEELPEIAVAREEVASAPKPAPLSPAPRPISVSINATPWATIEIDGEEIGVTPMAGVLLTPGDHEFRVRMPDGSVLEEVIRIAPDNRHIAFMP